MTWQTLIDATALRNQLADPLLVVVDCRFELSDPGSGERAYLAGHVPGAHYAHLDRDLSDLSRVGRGRHPLPDSDAFCACLQRWGITPAHQVVAYDADSGMFAARLWWMLRLLGHRRIAVLDGGFAAWQAQGGELERTVPRAGKGQYKARFDSRSIVTTAVIAARMANGNGLLLDARAAARFRGDVEPLDARAGHIPGAINRPFADNLGADGCFLPAPTLASQFHALINTCPAQEVVHMCGSGVTACHNLLAMEHAGLTGSRIYAGSWSEWISVPSRPVAVGE
ncbi:sulfurtransferase [Xanthomonadaceae bacterium JHOS43]|nr:sulfurtransferase [Xanthomonadaceae bacterium JHOS43]MCX7563292.1 sulfurtransferase [Xanthomonadaceae bacterium XH05]